MGAEEGSATLAPCPGCGAVFPLIEGPTHRYIGASAGCWAIFGEVLAREYEDVGYWRVHRLTVDAYAAQHPGVPSPQSIRSVAIHLLGLYVSIEQGASLGQVGKVLERAAGRRTEYIWLPPPASPGDVTVLDVHAAADAEEHADRVWRWAKSVWEAWAAHHATIRMWAG